jgi:hypothetical protein
MSSEEKQPRRPRYEVRLSDPDAKWLENKLEVVVTVENLGKNPVFVVEGMRRLEVTNDGQDLTLWFSDLEAPEDDPPNLHRDFTIPRLTAVEPGHKLNIRTEVPAQMKRLVIGDDGKFTIRPLDLEGVKQVYLKIGVDDSPFYYNPNKTSLREQLREWGSIREVRIDQIKGSLRNKPRKSINEDDKS